MRFAAEFSYPNIYGGRCFLTICLTRLDGLGTAYGVSLDAVLPTVD
jgi:hypothetical protein